MKSYKHILFATDLHDLEHPELEKIKGLVGLFDAKLSLVHAIEPIPAYGYPDLTALQSPIIDQARGEMAKMAEKLGVNQDDTYIEFGPVKIEILRIAEKLKDVDLIIIGSHGRHGLQRLLGSGANAIVHNAKCDVLTIRISE